MKLAIKGAAAILVCVMLVIIFMDSSTSTIKRDETATIAEKAAYDTVKTVKNKSTEIDSNQEMVAEAVKNVIMNKKSNATITVNVISVDAKNGMVDLEVIQTFKHANGKSETVKERRTVILDKKAS